jgi:hypothetical protein
MAEIEVEEQYLVLSPVVWEDDAGIYVPCNHREPIKGIAIMKTGEVWPAELLLRSLRRLIDECVKSGERPLVALGPMLLVSQQ